MTIKIEIKLTETAGNSPFMSSEVNKVGAELISKITDIISKQEYKHSKFSFKVDMFKDGRETFISG